MKTSWYCRKMSGWAASDGISSTCDTPFLPWQASQVSISSFRLSAEADAAANDPIAAQAIRSHRTISLLSPTRGRGWERGLRTSLPPLLAPPPNGGEELRSYARHHHSYLA